MENLTEEKYAMLREEFDTYDLDGSGFLEASEVAAGLTVLGKKVKYEDLDSALARPASNAYRARLFQRRV